MRAIPWRRGNLPDCTVELLISANWRNLCGNAYGQKCQVRLAKLRLQFQLATFCHAEQHTASLAHSLAGLHASFEDVPAHRCANVQPRGPCPQLAQLRIRDVDPRPRTVARSRLAIDIGF
jgi:hypothetical protein